MESRRADLDVGLERMRERTVELRDGPPPELVAGVAVVADSSMRDDVTVFAVRVR